MQMKTSEGSPRAALLQQATSKGQIAAHMHPLSVQRPGMLSGPSQGNNPMMTLPPWSAQATKNKSAQSQLLTLVMHLLASQRGGN